MNFALGIYSPRPLKQLFSDLCGIFGSRVVVANHECVGTLCSHRSHRVTLGCVSIAIRTEEHDDFA